MQAAMRLGLLFLVLAAAGCSSGRRPMRMHGEVAFDGKPVENGTIVFTPVDGTRNPSTGGVIRDGRYDIPTEDGPVAGETYKVEITATAPTGKTMRNVAEPGGPAVPVLRSYIPAAYNQKTTLRVTVSPRASENRHDFKLERTVAQRKR